jgi:GalNAc-alpha-(1->4)-GalNAc-alpha-(1->3)-diNAcBac-PP-undecaprenol alpha-1,4-N-acetyl-D-galactosaminyltransferase
MEAMRITLIISTLGPGGAERVMSNMANYWAAHGQHVTLVTVGSPDTDFYALDRRVQRVGLGLMGYSSNVLAGVRNNVLRVRRLRQAIRASQPDVVLSSVDRTNVLVLVSTLGLGRPVIVFEQIDPRQHAVGYIWAALRRLLYPRSAAVVVLTHGIRPWAEHFVKKETVHVIPNPVQVPATHIESNDAQEPRGSGRTIAAMGRLNPQKGFDLLLKAFARCAEKHTDWSLMILGEGDERPRLEAMASDLGIKDRMTMPGLAQDPFRILRGSDLFVLSSRYEGFPLALVEAMACGLAVISTDCDTGPREIIRDGMNGVLVPSDDVDALVLAMDRLMTNQAERQRLGANALEITERFSLEKIMNIWDNLLSLTCRVPNT